MNTTSTGPSAVIGVSALNRLARDILERALPLMWVHGEISNLSLAPSGHWYFTLKDSGAQVRCAMFRSKSRFLAWRPENGMQVEVRALVTLYEPRGEYQLTIETMRRAGIGALYEAFERLKARLESEGLFDTARKRALPAFPRAIGVVTSPQAAALRDVLKILAGRMPCAPVIVYPTPVQGAGAAQSIAAAIRIASARNECDVLIVCRGGGSIEDLWSFNEEEVARAIVASRVPVVSGVGHETDFTIADFVADARAPTPSAAAQMVCPDRRELERQRLAIVRALNRAIERKLQRVAQQLDYLARRLIDPRTRLRVDAERTTRLAQRLRTAWNEHASRSSWALTERLHSLSLVRPAPVDMLVELRHLGFRLNAANAVGMRQREAGAASLGVRLEALSPQAVLDRGYAIATDRAGRVLRASAGLVAGDHVNIRFAQGSAQTEVRGIDADTRP